MTLAPELREGQDFAFWLKRANVAGRIRILAATDLDALLSGDGESLAAEISEVRASPENGTATFIVRPPDGAANAFFKVTVE